MRFPGGLVHEQKIGCLPPTGLGDIPAMLSFQFDPRDRNGPALSALDRRTIAVQLAIAGSQRVFLGRAHYLRDDELGNVLRIEIPAEVGCEFLLVENRWRGHIESEDSLGCDYSIRLDKL